MPVISFSGRKGEAGKKGRLNFFKSGRTNPLKDGTEYSVQPEAWSRRSRSIQSPWEATALSIASVACAGARRGRGMSLQPSLFTRLTAVEAELSAMKDILAELKVNQDELRRDRDEWRWRVERLLADLQQGTWWRWYNRAAAALDAGTARFRGVLADLQNRLSEMRASRELLQGRDQRPAHHRRLDLGEALLPIALHGPCRALWQRRGDGVIRGSLSRRPPEMEFLVARAIRSCPGRPSRVRAFRQTGQDTPHMRRTSGTR